MYKWMLCFRYLRTRLIALVPIISVMLGVWTMIVVNSVMAGFTTEMKNRIHGVLSDITFESRTLEGFADPEGKMARIREVAGDEIEGMTPTVAVPGMLSYQIRGTWFTHTVNVVGIDEKTQGAVSDFSKYLQHPENRKQMSFDLREGGYDVLDHQAAGEPKERFQMNDAGWRIRRAKAAAARAMQPLEAAPPGPLDAKPPIVPPPTKDPPGATDIFSGVQTTDPRAKDADVDPSKQQYTGAVIGIAISCFRDPEGAERFMILPGEDIRLTIPTAGTPPKGVTWNFTIVDFYESKMAEMDSQFVFVPIQKMQELRGMHGSITQIQIKLKPGANLDEVRDRLRHAFPNELFSIMTWRDQRSSLLSAVDTETKLLNVLLFFIVAVAGFGILAIFYMIVVEKTRDIGILKSLGASSAGIMGIFLTYGLLLGVVGAGLGLIGGLATAKNINAVADFLGQLTGRAVFDPQVYYFYTLPSIIDPVTIAWIIGAAIAVSVLASVLPAYRAATLHPVEALRYE